MHLCNKCQLVRTVLSMKKRKLLVGCHHRTLTPLPSRWDFPKLIQNWFLANEAENIPPFIDLVSKAVRHWNNGMGNRMRLHVMAVMRSVELEAREKQCWVEKKSQWSSKSVQDMFDTIRFNLQVPEW